jgi:hypothetical protein
VTGRVEVHAHVVLGLVVGQYRPGRDGVLPGGGQVPDLDVQVQLHRGVAWTGRPDRPHVRRLVLEGQAGAAIRGAQLDPAGLILLHRPAEQPTVEGGQFVSVRRAQDHARQPEHRRLRHSGLLSFSRP